MEVPNKKTLLHSTYQRVSFSFSFSPINLEHMTHINSRKLENYGMTQGFNLDSSTGNMKNHKHDKLDIPPHKRAKQGGTGILAHNLH